MHSIFLKEAGILLAGMSTPWTKTKWKALKRLTLTPTMPTRVQMVMEDEAE